MIDVKSILSEEDIAVKISELKKRTTPRPSWSELATDYEPGLHKIVSDTSGRKDKHHSDGSCDKAARIPIGLEKLLTKRMTEFMFAIPVKRVYIDADTEQRKNVSLAIERIYNVAHMDSENKKRGIAYFASTEILTVWYAQRSVRQHNLYGFPCNFKLKCKTFSPMDGTELYPLIDEYGEMHSMSFEYRKKVLDSFVTYFETFTAEGHYIWKKGEDSEWEEVLTDNDMPIGKIPGVYISRFRPIWDGLVPLREELEYCISRESDVIAYNSAPILKVAGSIVGEEMKGETRRVYRVTEGGDVSYVSWSQADSALQNHVKTILNLYFMQAQIPDISFENIRNLGNIGYDARKMLLTDAHMKVGDESGPWLEFLERESNVIKAFLKRLNVESPGDLGFKDEDIDAVQVTHVITPFIQEDESLNIDKWRKAGGDVPVVSPLEAIKNAGISKDPEKTLADIMAYNLAMQAAKQPVEGNGGGGDV